MIQQHRWPCVGHIGTKACDIALWIVKAEWDVSVSGDAVCFVHCAKRNAPVISISHELPYGFIKHCAGRAESYVAQKFFPDQLCYIGKGFGLKPRCQQLLF